MFIKLDSLNLANIVVSIEEKPFIQIHAVISSKFNVCQGRLLAGPSEQSSDLNQLVRGCVTLKGQMYVLDGSEEW